MSTESKGIYHWKLGDIALARISLKAYARVRVVKDEKGLFYDDKDSSVLAISGNEDGSITVTKELCYYLENCRTNHRFWLPYTSLHLAERSRPYYGIEKVNNKDKSEVSDKSPAVIRKVTEKEEHVTPLEATTEVKEADSDLNTTFNKGIKTMGPRIAVCESAFDEFIRRGKEMFFDQFLGESNEDIPKLFRGIISTEDKFDAVSRTIATEKEMEDYLHQCWRSSIMPLKKSVIESEESTEDEEDNVCLMDLIPIHITWCIVCGQLEDLEHCSRCPAAFHIHCHRAWHHTVKHRKKTFTPEGPKPITLVEKIFSSTRMKSSLIPAEGIKEEAPKDICPSCAWGPQVGYGDIVWNKLGQCGWWPARVLPPGNLPTCLLPPKMQSWPVKYYGTSNHAWARPARTCLFFPCHADSVESPEENFKDAVMDANDEYITVYLT